MTDPILRMKLDTRGELFFDINKCDQCQDCERICPSAAITVYPEEKKIEWNPFKCIYCHTCIRTCMHKAISALDNVQASDYEKGVKTFD